LTKSDLSGITEFMPDKPSPICQIDQIRRDVNSLMFHVGIIMDRLEKLPTWESVTPVAIFATVAGAATGALLTLAFFH
jgi:hypothetical protein